MTKLMELILTTISTTASCIWNKIPAADSNRYKHQDNSHLNGCVWLCFPTLEYTGYSKTGPFPGYGTGLC
jgi:hypothetical protein